MVDLLVGGLFVWLVSWLEDLLVGKLADWLISGLFGWLVGWKICGLAS